MKIQKFRKNFYKSLIKNIISDDSQSPLKSFPSCLKKGDILISFIEKLAGIKFKKHIKYPETKKEIEINFKNIYSFLSNEGFDTKNFDQSSLINGDDNLLLDFISKVTLFFISGKTKNQKISFFKTINWLNDFAEKEKISLQGNRIKIEIQKTKDILDIKFIKVLLFEILKKFLKDSEHEKGKEIETEREKITLLKLIVTISKEMKLPSLVPKSFLEEGFEIEENISEEYKETESSLESFFSLNPSSFTSQTETQTSTDNNDKNISEEIENQIKEIFIIYISFLRIKIEPSSSSSSTSSSSPKKDLKKKTSNKEEKETKEEKELKRLEQERKILQEKVKIKEEKEKLKSIEREKKKGEKEERNKERAKEKEEKKDKEENAMKEEISKILSLIETFKEEDNKRALKHSFPEQKKFLSFLIDSTLEKGGHTKDIKVTIFGPLSPSFYERSFNPQRLKALSNNNNNNNNTNNTGNYNYSLLVGVKKEAAQRVEDLQNGKYLVSHNFLSQGVFALSVLLWGRELSISPLFVLVDERGGVWLRPSGNSVSEVTSAELETGKHLMERETLQRHRDASLKTVSAFVGENMRKQQKEKGLRVMSIVSEEAKDLEERQEKEGKKIKRSLKGVKEAFKELVGGGSKAVNKSLEFSAKGEVEDLEDAIKGFFDNRKKIFLNLFKYVIGFGFVFQSVPLTKLFKSKPIKVKVVGLSTGFMSLVIDNEKLDFNKNSANVEYLEKEGVLKLQCGGKTFSLKGNSNEVTKYFTKGFKLLSLV